MYTVNSTFNIPTYHGMIPYHITLLTIIIILSDGNNVYENWHKLWWNAWLGKCIYMYTVNSYGAIYIIIKTFLMQDEFCTYMLLEYQEKDSMKGEEESSPFPYPLKQLPKYA